MPEQFSVKPSVSPATEERRKFLSEAFHAFHQPLTALHCGLELGLLKERSLEEYREKLSDALANAGAVLQFSKAIRELAEASDPGEGLGRVEVKGLLDQLGQELTYVAEAGVIAVRVTCPEQVNIAGDRNKLLQVLGNVTTIFIRSSIPGGVVTLSTHLNGASVCISGSLEGNQREREEKTLQGNIDQIRLDSARSYAWTLGGEFSTTSKGFVFRLPVLK